ncbi:unnamed protein product [Brassicogethes aeneus]|uniref:Homologous recombination OB-fold protein OB-fold domain-containing protein n=1 Tax=Brassicogethes aeneus TaxID=1431903 RepID=A0A9P0FD43_BRAAE|nr:unnamed protein product [Brassicogethes aeneus]
MFENNEDFDFNDDDNSFNNDKIDEILSKTEKNVCGNLGDTSLNKCKVIKRKFPGPAGLLPDRKKSSRIFEDIPDENLDDNESNVFVCSQMPQNKFNEEPWMKMLEDFDDYQFLLDKYTIHWIKSQTRCKKLYNQKVPFLVAVIENLEVTNAKIPTINITLKDKSGSIQGTILNNLYEEYSDFLTVGSVVILKQFGVLTTGENNNYLTITTNNLLTLYSMETAKTLDDLSEKSLGVKKIVVNELDCEEILKNVNEIGEKSIKIIKPNLSKLKVNSSTNFNQNKTVETTKSIFDQNCDVDSLFDDDFNIPDNFEEVALSQISTKSTEKIEENKKSDIIKNIFEGINTDDIFDHF